MSSRRFTRSLSAAARQLSLTSKRVDAFFLRRLAIHVAVAARQAAREVDRPSHVVQAARRTCGICTWHTHKLADMYADARRVANRPMAARRFHA